MALRRDTNENKMFIELIWMWTALEQDYNEYSSKVLKETKIIKTSIKPILTFSFR